MPIAPRRPKYDPIFKRPRHIGSNIPPSDRKYHQVKQTFPIIIYHMAQKFHQLPAGDSHIPPPCLKYAPGDPNMIQVLPTF